MNNISFLVISQKAIGTPDYSLKDLPGHGRFDIVVRSLLQASTLDHTHNYSDFHCLMKGGPTIGWLSWRSKVPDEEDEVSISAILQREWNNYFTQGSLSHFLRMYEQDHPNYSQILLSEDGLTLEEIDLPKDGDLLIILGAQHDLVKDDIAEFSNLQLLSLGSQSMLASHAIAYFRMTWTFP